MIKTKTPRTLIMQLIGLLDMLVPKSPCVFLQGTPPTEGNVAEIARVLSRETDVMVYWVDAPEDSYMNGVGILPTRIKRLGGPWHPRTFFAYLRSRVVLYTHGIYDAPPSPRRKIVVNLWHGEQAKGGGLFMPQRRLGIPTANYLTGSSLALADLKCSLALIDPKNYLHTGNPRTDQFFRPASAPDLEDLGLDPARPFVMWMPTFRRAKDSEGAVAWSNTTEPQSDDALARGVAAGVSSLASMGIQVVVKPHPLDFANRDVDGALTLHDSDLEAAGVPLYCLLGASSGLVSDYSSIWIDYLIQGSPLAFFTPDSIAFEQGRGRSQLDVEAVLPGRNLTSSREFMDFGREILGANGRYAVARSAAMAALGLRYSESVAQDTWEALVQREPRLATWNTMGSVPARSRRTASESGELT